MQFLPYKRTAEFARDQFGAAISEGTLLNIILRAYATLEPIEKEIVAALPRKKLINCDETGMRVGSLLRWLHSVSTAYLTYYSCQNRRGEEAMKNIGILSKLLGRAVHDGWKAYFRFSCSHGLCNAHHLRELIEVFEQHNQQWAKDMIDVLLNAKDAVTEAKARNDVQVHPALLRKLERRYTDAIKAGYGANPPPEPTGKRGRPKQTIGGNLVGRLDTYRNETLAFLYDFGVPFDNNLAERDIRMMKLKQKISGCFRSTEGVDAFCRVRGYISTMRKQGHNVLEILTSVCSGKPIMPDLTSE